MLNKVIVSLLCLFFIGIGMYAIHDDKVNKERYLKSIQSIYDSIDNPCEIVEIYAHRIGIKEANYSYPVNCIVVDSSGKRFLIEEINNPAIVGDYWNICINNDRLELCELVKETWKIKIIEKEK